MAFSHSYVLCKILGIVQRSPTGSRVLFSLASRLLTLGPLGCVVWTLRMTGTKPIHGATEPHVDWQDTAGDLSRKKIHRTPRVYCRNLPSRLRSAANSTNCSWKLRFPSTCPDQPQLNPEAARTQLGPKCPLPGAIYPQLKILGGSWNAASNQGSPLAQE